MCLNEIFKELKRVESLSKSEFTELLSLATKVFHFSCDRTLYKQIAGVFMGPP